MSAEHAATMDPTEVSVCRSIASCLRDVADAAERGTRPRAYCLSDLEEDAKRLSSLVRSLRNDR